MKIKTEICVVVSSEQNEVDKFPEAYPLTSDNKYAFNPSGMVVYLMKAIQEQQVIIDDLKSRIETLEG